MGETITLYDTTPRHSSAAGHATTDAHGRYHIRDAVVPVQTSFNGHAFGKEMTPYAGFILSGLAPGLGVSWSRSQSMYSVNPPHPDDIQGRLPLGEPIALDLTFPRPAFLKGSIVDEHGDPVAARSSRSRIAICSTPKAGRPTIARGTTGRCCPTALAAPLPTGTADSE